MTNPTKTFDSAKRVAFYLLLASATPFLIFNLLFSIIMLSGAFAVTMRSDNILQTIVPALLLLSPLVAILTFIQAVSIRIKQGVIGLYTFRWWFLLGSVLGVPYLLATNIISTIDTGQDAGFGLTLVKFVMGGWPLTLLVLFLAVEIIAQVRSRGLGNLSQY